MIRPTNGQMVETILNVIRSMTMGETPKNAAVGISTIVLNALHEIPNERWLEMKEASRVPCSRKDCNCHIRLPEILAALETIRNLGDISRS